MTTVHTALRGLCTHHGQRDPHPGTTHAPSCPSPVACHAVSPGVAALVAVLGTVQTELCGFCSPRGQRDPDPGPTPVPTSTPTPSRPPPVRRGRSPARRIDGSALAVAAWPRSAVDWRCLPTAPEGAGLERGPWRLRQVRGQRGTRRDTGGQGTPRTRDTAAPAPSGHGRAGSAAAAGPGVRSGRAASGAGTEPRGSPARGSPGRAGHRSGAGTRRGLAVWGRAPGAAAGGGERTPGDPGAFGPVPCPAGGTAGILPVQVPCPERGVLREFLPFEFRLMLAAAPGSAREESLCP